MPLTAEGFSEYITRALKEHENVELITAEADKIPEGEVVIATGPLSSDAIAAEIEKLCPDRRPALLRRCRPDSHAPRASIWITHSSHRAMIRAQRIM